MESKTREEMIKEMGIPSSIAFSKIINFIRLKFIFDQTFTDTTLSYMYQNIKHKKSIKDRENEIFLYFLNEILDECGYDLVDDIDDFRIDRKDLLVMDGEKFVNDIIY
jgi:hypothetical protein